MTTFKLDDEIYSELHVLTRSEWKKLMYTDTATFDRKIKTAFLPGYGTTLFFENKHFIIVADNVPLRKYEVWRNHKIIGHVEITKGAAEKANSATNAEFYFNPEKIPKTV